MKNAVVFESSFDISPQELFQWHMRQTALVRLLPPWLTIEITKQGAIHEVGSTTHLKIRFGPLCYTWIAKHTHFTLNHEFIDEAVKSPFPFFKHTHSILPAAKGSILRDQIEFSPPFFLSARFIEKSLHRLLAFRHQRLKRDLAHLASPSFRKKKILLTGASGLVGGELHSFLVSLGHTVVCLKRKHQSRSTDEILWDPFQEGICTEAFEGFDAVIHLAGENIGEKRWTKKQKEKIFQSRARDTWHLSQILSRLSSPPKAFLSASGIGIYGDRDQTIVTETTPPSADFLSEVCIHWERASESLTVHGIRRCIARFGLILSPKGGILRKICPLFRLHLGAKMGGAKQWMPWVAIDDVVYAIHYLLLHDELAGVFNVCSETPVQQEEFAKALAHALHTKLWLSIPAPLLYLLGKERARSLLLSSTRALPQRLVQSGFRFCFHEIKEYFSECF